MATQAYRPPDPSRWPRRKVLFVFRIHRSSNIVTATSRPHEIALEVPLQPTEAPALERQLQAALGLPPFVTIFSIVRADEAQYAPPLPLMLLHGIVDSNEQRCAVDCIVRPIIQARPATTLRPPPMPALPIERLLLPRAALDEKALRVVGRELLERLRRERVVRLRADRPLAATLARCYAALPTFFARPRHAKARLHCSIAPSPSNEEEEVTAASPADKAYAGMGEDCGREWLQVRRRYGLQTERSCCLPDGTPPDCAAAFDGLRELAAACVHALALAVGASPAAWLRLSDLDEQVGSQPPAAAGCRRGGPSVLRLYRYLEAGVGTGCHAHSDLGLLTLSPCPTVPGLLVYDPEALEWLEAEVGMHESEISLFGGEQLAFLSGGLIPAPLHRVPAPEAAAAGGGGGGCDDGGGSGGGGGGGGSGDGGGGGGGAGGGGVRYSMPFFARCHPEVPLVPLSADDGSAGGRLGGGLGSRRAATPTTPCSHFVVNQLFRRRPWRQSKVEGADEGAGEAPDY